MFMSIAAVLAGSKDGRVGVPRREQAMRTQQKVIVVGAGHNVRPEVKEEGKNSVTNLHSIDIATIKDMQGMLTVPLTKAKSLRSRVTGNHQARF
jgi:hypothetical protein